MVTRQSARCINFTQADSEVQKNNVNMDFSFINFLKSDYIDHGDPTFACKSYGALLWHSETLRGAANTSFESYSISCSRGKVTLGTELKEPPELLKDLIKNEHPKSASFIDNIRRYNSMFAFTSMAGHQDTSVNVGRGPYCYRLHGENYHLAGSLLPKTGKPAKFAQLYIYDTENEITNRIKAVSKEASTSSNKHEIDFQLTTDIRDMLDSINPLVKDFRMAGERIKSSDDKNLKLKLIGTRKRDGRDYNLPTASEVAALIVGDFDSTKNKRDIILHCQDGDLMRISELHPSYLAMQYPLFFPYAEDGYRTDIFHYGVTDYDEKKIKERARLFQQFLMDGYTMIEAERISFNRKKQKDLRSETYFKLAKLADDPNSGVQLRGKKVLLPSSFTGSPRGLKSEDQPDIVTRVFKIKLDSLMKDLKDGRIFGRVKGAVYTIKFQKRGLSHCHILLWLETKDKITTTAKIDKYISAEIPNKDEDPDLYQIVTDHMMHGPCGPENPSCPCT
ncbi:putative PIF1 DNA helicase/replication protein A1-like protein, partial [Tanacetum coccineum]